MPRILISLLFWIVVCLAAPALDAQSSPQFRPEEIRARMEAAIVRQKHAVDLMSESLANQQRALGRQRSVTLAADFFRPVPRYRAAPVPSVCDGLPSSQLDSLIDTAAKSTDLEPDLIRGVMKQESAFQPCAVSSKGAIGLMQLEPATAADLGVKDLFDPEDNVLGGARLLRQLMDRYGGDLKKTLGAYNAGMGRVDASMGVPDIPETINYVNQILNRLPQTSPLKQALDKVKANQLERIKAPSTNFLLIGSEGGK